MFRAVALILAFSCHTAHAAPIRFIQDGHGAGSLNGVPFESVAFRITSVGDTEDRQSVDEDGVHFIDHAASMITIQGVGTFDVTSGTRTYVNNKISMAGYSRGTENGADLFDGPTDDSPSTWDMRSSIGPIVGRGGLSRWDSTLTDVITNAGVLRFDETVIPDAMFQAIVPEPSSLTLLAFGAAGILARRRMVPR